MPSCYQGWVIERDLAVADAEFSYFDTKSSLVARVGCDLAWNGRPAPDNRCAVGAQSDGEIGICRGIDISACEKGRANLFHYGPYFDKGRAAGFLALELGEIWVQRDRRLTIIEGTTIAGF